MDRRAPRAAASARTFAAVAVVLAAGLAPPAGPHRPAPSRPRSVSAGPAPGGPSRPARPPAAGMVIRMAAPPRQFAARPRFRMHTLTIKGFSLAGKPDTGDLVQLFDVDNTALLDPQAGAGVFHDGVMRYSVPSGHYFAIAEFGGSAKAHGNRFVVLPQFTVTGNRTITIRGTAASSEVTMVTPRPATTLTTDVWLLRTGTAGPPIVLELYFPGTSVWLSPSRARPTVGTLRVAVNQHLESPPGHGVPYEYTLSYTDPPGIIPPQRYLVRNAGLATVHERFYQAVPGSGGWAFNGSFPGTNPNVNQQWFGSIRLLHRGERLTENWDAYPLHPAANVLLDDEPNMFGAIVPSALRAGNTLRLSVDPFDDNQPGHQIGVFFPVKGVKLAGTYQVDENGRKIAGGNAVTQASPDGEFAAQATMTGHPATIRFSLDVSRTSSLFPLSTATGTVWTWHSTPSGTGSLPAGWTCVPFQRVRDCAVQPMMTLDYRWRACGWTARHRPGGRWCTCWPATCRRSGPRRSPGRRSRCPSTAAPPGTGPGSPATAAGTPRRSPPRRALS
jgi:hypothetical protein